MKTTLAIILVVVGLAILAGLYVGALNDNRDSIVFHPTFEDYGNACAPLGCVETPLVLKRAVVHQ